MLVKLGWCSDGTGYSEVACVPVQVTEDQRKTAIKFWLNGGFFDTIDILG